MADNTSGFGGIGFGKNSQPLNPKPNSPNGNLTAALRASLKIVESEENPIPSPLEEATPDSVDILLDRINNHMVEGKILSDDDLRMGIDLYRAAALRFAQEQQTKKPRTRSTTSKSTLKQVLDLDFGDEE